jgi:hypothetical protein
MTGCDHEHNETVIEAARWLATGGSDKTRAPVPQLRERFGLSLAEAVEAIREAALIRARAH